MCVCFIVAAGFVPSLFIRLFQVNRYTRAVIYSLYATILFYVFNTSTEVTVSLSPTGLPCQGELKTTIKNISVNTNSVLVLFSVLKFTCDFYFYFIVVRMIT